MNTYNPVDMNPPNKDRDRVDPRVEHVLERLAFQPEGVITAAAENVLLFKDVADYRIDCLHNFNVADMFLDQTHAQRSIEVRDQYKRADMKLTEDGLKAVLTLDPKIAAARTKRMRTEEIDTHAKLLLEMIRMRRDCLEIVAGLIGSAEAMQRAAEDASEKMASLRETARRRYPGSRQGAEE